MSGALYYVSLVYGGDNYDTGTYNGSSAQTPTTNSATNSANAPTSTSQSPGATTSLATPKATASMPTSSGTTQAVTSAGTQANGGTQSNGSVLALAGLGVLGVTCVGLFVWMVWRNRKAHRTTPTASGPNESGVVQG